VEPVKPATDEEVGTLRAWAAGDHEVGDTYLKGITVHVLARLDTAESALAAEREARERAELELARYKNRYDNACRDRDKLQARVADLAAALHPFAEYAAVLDGHSPPVISDSYRIGSGGLTEGVRADIEARLPTVGDCRRAAELLEGK